MRNEQHGDLAFELVDGPGEVLGVRGVEVGGGFVEDENARLLEQRTGDGDALFLAARKPGTALADLGLIAVGQGFDGVVDFGPLAGLHDLLKTGMRVGEQKIVIEGAGEDHCFLRHDAELAAQFIGGKVAEIAAIEQDAALFGKVKPLQQFCQRALA